jgi:hypothetical protein
MIDDQRPTIESDTPTRITYTHPRPTPATAQLNGTREWTQILAKVSFIESEVRRMLDCNAK